MSLFAKDPTAAGLNLPSRVGTGLVLLSSWTHAHLRRGQRCWVGLQEIRAWLLVPSQAWGSCCGRSHWGNQYPGLRSTFLCHSSAAKDRALFPSSPPLLPLRWPQTRPLLAARSPHSLPRTVTQWWHWAPSRLRREKHPANIATCHNSGGKKKRLWSCL